jgi:hypothetical protein
LINEEGLDYLIVQRRLFPNMIDDDFESGSNLFARTLFDAGGLIDRLQALDFCARLVIKSCLLGRPIPLSEGELGHEHTVLPMGCDRRRPTRSERKLGHHEISNFMLTST